MDEMPSLPPIVVAENVVGLLSAAQGSHYLSLHRALSERGYRVGALVLDAIHWLPQSRPRVFVVGVRKDKKTDDFEATEPLWCHTAAVRRVAELTEGFIWWALPKPPARRKRLEDIVDFEAEEFSSRRSQHNLRLIPAVHRQRMQAMANGDQRVFPGYKRIRSGKQVLELRFDSVAGCLRTPQGGSSRQFLVIYRDGKFETRLLTVRETARLMGVRESYRIEGSYNDGYKAMGDAVAIPVVRHLARHLLAPLSEGWCG
jgi:DNA (cytosine-5)-methyltransferase 1